MRQTHAAPRGAGLKPHLALVAVQLMFGTWPIIGKLALRELPSTGLVAFRIAGGALAFAALLRFTHHRPVKHGSDYARLALYSLLGVVLNQFLFVKGLAYSTVVNANILGTAIPVFTLLVSLLLGRERASPRTWLGMALAACGVVYLVDPLRADFSGGKTLGNVLLVANTLCYGTYLALTQDVLKRYGALTTITWMFAFGCVAALPLGGYHLAHTNLEGVGWGVWLAVAYIVLVPTVGAYYLNAWALARVAPSTVAAYIYLQPLIAFAVAPLVLGAEERWTWRTTVAAALICAGVWVVTRGALRSRAAEEAALRPEAVGG